VLKKSSKNASGKTITATGTRKKKNKVVLLVHGFQCSSVHWLGQNSLTLKCSSYKKIKHFITKLISLVCCGRFLNEKDKTLPFMLLQQGYDLWFINLRGSPHSKKHSKFPTTSPKFWDFRYE
jgi:pimeloyl-ACP methyl ester carboxylesterase